MRLKIGITGGIGSGKSTVCQIFATLGIPVYYADAAAKRLMVEDEALVAGIRKLFGEAAYDAEGQLQRQHLAQIVFQDRRKLALLNALVHPAVARDSLAWHAAQTKAPYTLKEAALLFESGSYQQLDQIICVRAPRALRLERVIQRDGITIEAVEARMAQQLPEAEKGERSDYLIENDGQQLLIPQVQRIHRAILARAEALRN